MWQRGKSGHIFEQKSARFGMTNAASYCFILPLRRIFDYMTGFSGIVSYEPILAVTSQMISYV